METPQASPLILMVARELLPLGCEAPPNQPTHFQLNKCTAWITTAAQPSGSKLPRHSKRHHHDRYHYAAARPTPIAPALHLCHNRE
ncbi:hypothetical protein DCC84_31195 [Pseudomonas sp. SXM-1]|nr:hypothetical protein DCC84_31195 [Pseudomonas sp. SXM-1]